MYRKEDGPENHAFRCCSMDVSPVDGVALRYGRVPKEPFYLHPVSLRLFKTRSYKNLLHGSCSGAVEQHL